MNTSNWTKRPLTSWNILPKLKKIGKWTSLALAGFFIYPQTRAKFELHYQETEHNKDIIDNCPSIKQGYFFPTLYLGYGVLQAVYGKHSTYHDTNIKFKNEILDLPDGGKLSLHWASHQSEPSDLKKKDAFLFIVPGLTGSSDEPYLRNITSEALDNGYTVCVFHNRGSAIEFTFPKTGYFDYVEDIRYAIEDLKKRFPDKPFFAIGHSFGANTLTNYLGKYSHENPFKAAAAIANPFDFLKVGEKILGTAFEGYLGESLKWWAKQHEHVFLRAPAQYKLDYRIIYGIILYLDKAMATEGMIKFDEYLTRRLLGFPSVVEYYHSLSSKDRLDKINIPLFCMNSKDDPILSFHGIPIYDCMLNKNIILMITNSGGHVGWFEGFFRPKRWYPKPTIEFINKCFQNYQAR